MHRPADPDPGDDGPVGRWPCVAAAVGECDVCWPGVTGSATGVAVL